MPIDTTNAGNSQIPQTVTNGLYPALPATVPEDDNRPPPPSTPPPASQTSQKQDPPAPTRPAPSSSAPPRPAPPTLTRPAPTRPAPPTPGASSNPTATPEDQQPPPAAASGESESRAEAGKTEENRKPRLPRNHDDATKKSKSEGTGSNLDVKADSTRVKRKHKRKQKFAQKINDEAQANANSEPPEPPEEPRVDDFQASPPEEAEKEYTLPADIGLEVCAPLVKEFIKKHNGKGIQLKEAHMADIIKYYFDGAVDSNTSIVSRDGYSNVPTDMYEHILYDIKLGLLEYYFSNYEKENNNITGEEEEIETRKEEEYSKDAQYYAGGIQKIIVALLEHEGITEESTANMDADDFVDKITKFRDEMLNGRKEQEQKYAQRYEYDGARFSFPTLAEDLKNNEAENAVKLIDSIVTHNDNPYIINIIQNYALMDQVLVEHNKFNASDARHHLSEMLGTPEKIKDAEDKREPSLKEAALHKLRDLTGFGEAIYDKNPDMLPYQARMMKCSSALNRYESQSKKMHDKLCNSIMKAVIHSDGTESEAHTAASAALSKAMDPEGKKYKELQETSKTLVKLMPEDQKDNAKKYIEQQIKEQAAGYKESGEAFIETALQIKKEAIKDGLTEKQFRKKLQTAYGHYKNVKQRDGMKFQTKGSDGLMQDVVSQAATIEGGVESFEDIAARRGVSTDEFAERPLRDEASKLNLDDRSNKELKSLLGKMVSRNYTRNRSKLAKAMDFAPIASLQLGALGSAIGIAVSALGFSLSLTVAPVISGLAAAFTILAGFTFLINFTIRKVQERKLKKSLTEGKDIKKMTTDELKDIVTMVDNINKLESKLNKLIKQHPEKKEQLKKLKQDLRNAVKDKELNKQSLGLAVDELLNSKTTEDMLLNDLETLIENIDRDNSERQEGQTTLADQFALQGAKLDDTREDDDHAQTQGDLPANAFGAGGLQTADANVSHAAPATPQNVTGENEKGNPSATQTQTQAGKG